MRPDDPDRRICERLLQRDPAGVELIVHKYGKLLWHIISGYLETGRREDIEEIYNDVLTTVWSDIEEFDPQRARFKTWLVMKTRYCTLMRRRKLLRNSHRAGPFHSAEVSLSPPNIALWMDLTLALSELKPLDRRIVYLCDYLRWEHRTVAEEVGMRINTLNTRLHRVRKQLRKSLRAWRPQEKIDE